MITFATDFSEMTSQEMREIIANERNKIETFDDLRDYIDAIAAHADEYNLTQRAFALSQGVIAVAEKLSEALELDLDNRGYVEDTIINRASYEFLLGFLKYGTKTGLRILDFDKMLSPFTGEYFDSAMSSTMWNLIRARAINLLDEKRVVASPRLIDHLRLIVDGNVPYGWRVNGLNVVEKEKE